jgi:peptidase M23-like protein
MATKRLISTLAALVALAAASPSQALAYGWPVKPFDQQHPVRGFFGDPRIAGHTEQFHFGVDVSAPNGTPVYATNSGRISFIHEDAVRVSGSGGVAFEYWHIVPIVRPGQQASAYRTLLGFVEKPWAHVHFSESRNGVYVNPLRSGAMRPYADTTKPRVARILVRLNGDVLTDVADDTPVAVPAPWAGLPVMPAVVRWRVDAGAWKTAVDFRQTIPAANAFFSVYAPETTQNRTHVPGLYRVRLVRGLHVASASRISVQVVDEVGNASVASVSLRRTR